MWHRCAVSRFESAAAMSLCALLGTSLFTGSCGDGEPQPTRAAHAVFPLVVVARRDGHQPVAGVKVVHDRTVLGVTDASGSVKLELKGVEGSTRSLGVVCPEQYASPEAPLVVGLRRMAQGSPAPRLQAECMPLTRSLVVGLRAENGPNLPVVRLNQVLGTTDAEGVAHLMIEATSSEQVTLTLDTRAYPLLRPQSPTLTFVARDRDELILLEQRFNNPKPVASCVSRPSGPKPL